MLDMEDMEEVLAVVLAQRTHGHEGLSLHSPNSVRVMHDDS